MILDLLTFVIILGGLYYIFQENDDNNDYDLQTY